MIYCTCSCTDIILWMSSNSIFSLVISSLYRVTSRHPEQLEVELRSERKKEKQKKKGGHIRLWGSMGRTTRWLYMLYCTKPGYHMFAKEKNIFWIPLISHSIMFSYFKNDLKNLIHLYAVCLQLSDKKSNFTTKFIWKLLWSFKDRVRDIVQWTFLSN